MVGSSFAYGLFISAGLALAVPAAVAEEEQSTGAPEAATLEPPPGAPAPEARQAGTASCEACSDHACTPRTVAGPCTVGKAVEALRRKQPPPQAPDGAGHRSRAVTGTDYKPLVLEDPPEPGRAEAGPEHRPPGYAPAGMPGVHGDSGRPLSERKSDSLSARTRFFRPLILTDEAPGEDAGPDETDGQDP